VTGYRALIIEATGCSPEDSAYVEELMRDANGGVLDHLSRARFRHEARRAFKAMPEVRAEIPSWRPFLP
jgi:hypothetical protein